MDTTDQGFAFRGQHVYADIYDLCYEEVMDARRLQRTLEEAIHVCGAQICGSVSKAFDPHGFTCLYLLAESHASIHTYPERRAIFFDAFTCGAPDPGVILRHFTKAFKHARVVFGHLERGETERRRTVTQPAPSRIEAMCHMGEVQHA